MVHVHNEVQFREESRGSHTRDRVSKIVVPLEKYNDSMSIEAWLTRLELHLEPELDKEDWARETLKLLSDKALKKASPIDRFLDQPNGYVALKEKLLSGQLEQKRSSSLEDLFTRRQRRNESPSQFAQALRDLAGDTFRSDDNLKSLFHKGLSSPQLQAITARKIWDPKERMSFDQLASYTDTEEDAIRMSANLLKSYQNAEVKTPQSYHSDSSPPYATNTQRNPRPEPRNFRFEQQQSAIRQTPTQDIRSQQEQQIYRSHAQATGDAHIEKPKCYYCHEKGHLARDCDKKMQEQNQPPNLVKHTHFADQVQTSLQNPEYSELARNQRKPIIASIRQHSDSTSSQAITGKVLFKQEVVTYLCDTGGDLTVISRAVYERINRQ